MQYLSLLLVLRSYTNIYLEDYMLSLVSPGWGMNEAKNVFLKHD